MISSHSLDPFEISTLYFTRIPVFQPSVVFFLIYPGSVLDFRNLGLYILWVYVSNMFDLSFRDRIRKYLYEATIGAEDKESPYINIILFLRHLEHNILSNILLVIEALYCSCSSFPLVVYIYIVYS